MPGGKTWTGCMVGAVEEIWGMLVVAEEGGWVQFIDVCQRHLPVASSWTAIPCLSPSQPSYGALCKAPLLTWFVCVPDSFFIHVRVMKQ